MSAEDYMPDDLGMEFWSSRGGGAGGYGPRQPMCYRCKSKQVDWRQLDGKWRLFTGAFPHQCDARDDFTATKEQS